MSRRYSRMEAEVEGDDEGTTQLRERPQFTRFAAHEDRDAAASRPEDVRREVNSNAWVNQTTLDAPKPRMGYGQRWIAQEPDEKFRQRLRQGWAPRDPATIPEHERGYYQTAKSNSGQDMIRVAGLILCEIPIEVAKKRRAAISDLRDSQMKSIPESLQELRKRGDDRFGPVKVESEENAMRGRQSATMVE